MTTTTSESTRVCLGLSEIEALCQAALCVHGVSEPNARSVARSIAAAEADGIASHGLLRLATYCAHAACGKVDGGARPGVRETRPAAWVADARSGFAHPAIELGCEPLVAAARRLGVATLAVMRSYNCGVVGHHVERLGGARLARARLREYACCHRALGSIPEGWALDTDGIPTTDPSAALAGSMLPAGGYKGAGIALLVDILAAVLPGARLSSEASSFADDKGGPPATGQLFIALDPEAFAGGLFATSLERLLAQMSSQPGARLPGARRIAARARAASEGVWVDRALHERAAALARPT